MTDVETVALREELARIIETALERHNVPLSDVEGTLDDADAILPIITRERAAALAAATPLIEARVWEECAQVADEHRCSMQFLGGAIQNRTALNIAAAIRKGRP